MAKSIAQLKKLAAERIIIPSATIQFQDEIELSAQSDPITGVATKLPGKTKNGSFRYILTTENGLFRFYSKEELPEVIENHSFGIQKLDDGKELYWY